MIPRVLSRRRVIYRVLTSLNQNKIFIKDNYSTVLHIEEKFKPHLPLLAE